ncbi:hypothetical protein BGW42_008105 [Actinomortierella wolfii]|nr:hypothetical protein BGW42_008105 [Actinomortierella wolfii]
MLSAVELNVNGLSVSIPPKPSLIASLTRTIRNWCQRPTTSSQNRRNHHFLCGSLQISTVSLADQCVATHDGLSIFRNVSLNVKPGQGLERRSNV